MSGRVAGKIAIVTGGASGIGRACCIRLAEEGASVVVTDLDQKMGQQTVDAIKAMGGTAEFIAHDVTDELQWAHVIDTVRNNYGRLDVLVNNAGIAIGGSIVDMTLADWHRQQAVNLDGVFLGVKHAIPLMRDTGGGSIINMSSVAGLKGSANLAAYNATKGGVRLFTKGVARECATKGWKIRVNSVHPGIIDTPIWTKIVPSALGMGENAVDVDAMSSQSVPMGLAGKPLDIANGVLYLASDDSTYVTGTELVIDGGISS